MKRVLVTIAACLTLTANLYSQCTPNAATGTPGVTPTPDNVTCIERGVPYDITMQLENFTTIQSLVTVNWARIDSLLNFPCGITWQANKLQFNGGETGCIRVSGTTTDPVGQYPLGIYMTVNVTALGQTLEQGGEINNLLAQLQSQAGINLGIDLGYYSRVIDPGTSCPAIDRSGSANNLTSSGATCSGGNPLSVSLSGDNSICSGESTTLTATAANSSGTVTYTWSSPGGSNQTISVNPSSTTPYSVTVNDQNGSATSSITVTVGPKPNAAFSATPSGQTVTLNNTSTGGATYSWNFGDTQTSTQQSPPAHTYSTDGNYTITLIVTSSASCIDTATQSVTIGCPPPTAAFTADPTDLTVAVTNSSSGATSYSWNFGDTQTSTQQNPAAHTYSSADTYIITLVVTNSCGSDTTTQSVTVIDVSINSIDYAFGFEVYPNPSSGIVTLEFSSDNSEDTYELSVMDAAGKTVFGEKIKHISATVQKQIDLSRLPKGTYTIRLNSDEGFGIKKLVLR